MVGREVPPPSVMTPPQRAIRRALCHYFDNKVIVEANRRLEDIVSRIDLPRKTYKWLLKKPIAAVAYWEKTYQIVAIAAFRDEWHWWQQRVLQYWCVDIDAALFLIEKQDEYQLHLLSLINEARNKGIPADDAPSTLLNARCPHCNAPLVARYQRSRSHGGPSLFFACSQYRGQSAEGTNCAGFTCGVDELEMYLSSRLIEKKFGYWSRETPGEIGIW